MGSGQAAGNQKTHPPIIRMTSFALRATTKVKMATGIEKAIRHAPSRMAIPCGQQRTCTGRGGRADISVKGGCGAVGCSRASLLDASLLSSCSRSKRPLSRSEVR